MEPQPARCNFYVRTQSKDGKFHYDRAYIEGFAGDGSLHTLHPPAVGDRVLLADDLGQVPSGVYRVIERAWLHVAYGSTLWPYGTASPKAGATLDLLVEKCDGMFMDESDLASPFEGS